MKSLFALLFGCSMCLAAKGQEKKLDCMLLQGAVQTEAFEKTFYLCKSNQDINIVDTSKFFESCTLKAVCQRKLYILHELNAVEQKSAIEIFRIDRKKNVFTLYFHRPLSGAALTLKLRYKKGKAKLLQHKSGAF
ncbi:MAG TPA: hypothetical protein VFV31_08630 [Chitinophagaceae bacterium]|nr:hypothetical protein [Chitinophagaceae bacterium]